MIGKILKSNIQHDKIETYGVKLDYFKISNAIFNQIKIQIII